MEIKLCIGKPNPKQDLFLRARKRHVGFGGSRGGGKSWAIRAKAKILAFKHPGIRIIIVRATYPELTENHIKPLKADLFVGSDKALAKYNDSKKELVCINGSTILFRYCQTVNDLDRFQGLECDVLFIDEATQFTEEMLKKLCAIVRGVNGFPKRVYYTCNPGGKGHGYIKRIFIDKKYEEGEDPEDYEFIQSLVTDNYVLMQNDKEYVKMLEALPGKLKEAWLYGNWDVFEGAFWEEFRITPDPKLCQEAGITTEEALAQRRYTHVIDPFEIPKTWQIYRSYDWGYGRPFSFCWYAVDTEGIAYKILEWYGCTRNPNEGIKWNNAQQFKHCQEIENTHRWLKGKHIYGVADPSIWDGSHDTDGISAAETAEKFGIYFDKGNNERVAGWMMMREYLKFDEEGRPMLYYFNTCVDSIRTIPLMMFDEHKVEDMDTSLEDHICDCDRYFCMSRPIAPRLIQEDYVPISDPLNQFNNRQGKYARFNEIKGGRI